MVSESRGSNSSANSITMLVSKEILNFHCIICKRRFWFYRYQLFMDLYFVNFKSSILSRLIYWKWANNFICKKKKNLSFCFFQLSNPCSKEQIILQGPPDAACENVHRGSRIQRLVTEQTMTVLERSWFMFMFTKGHLCFVKLLIISNFLSNVFSEFPLGTLDKRPISPFWKIPIQDQKTLVLSARWLRSTILSPAISLATGKYPWFQLSYLKNEIISKIAFVLTCFFLSFLSFFRYGITIYYRLA